MRETTEPTLNEYGSEVHPAWAMIGASRVQSGGAGAVLFDSDIRHNHYVTVRLSKAQRKRDLNRDWLHGGKQIIEVAMSEAQWASFVSSMNVGSGVPCTLLANGLEDVPGMPYEPRLQESMDEVRGAADAALEEVKKAFEAVKAKPTKANIRSMEIVLQNATPNVEFVAKSLTEHAENVAQKMRADVEAFVVTKAQQLGLDPADIGGMPALGQGDETEGS